MTQYFFDGPQNAPETLLLIRNEAVGMSGRLVARIAEGNGELKQFSTLREVQEYCLSEINLFHRLVDDSCVPPKPSVFHYDEHVKLAKHEIKSFTREN